MAVCDAVCSVECKGLYGTDYLATDGAGLTGGQVAVVAVSQLWTGSGDNGENHLLFQGHLLII